MYDRMHMLETIYEVDEELLSDDDSSKHTMQRSRLSYYICLCLIGGCFCVVSMIITISLNPSHISNVARSIALNSNDKLKLSDKIIDHLGTFSKQINEQIDFQQNQLAFFTSTISSNSSFDVEHQNIILLIYGHVQYSQSCIDNNQCRDNLRSKLKINFIKLSNLLTTVELPSYYDKQIQLDWCHIIENSTNMILISLASIKTKNQTTIETISDSDSNSCENLDQIISTSATIDILIKHKDMTKNVPLSVIVQNQKLIYHTDMNKNSIITDDQGIKIHYSGSKHCSRHSDHQNEKSMNCHGDTNPKYITI